MSLLQGLRVVQIGEGLAAAICGRLFADVGADVSCVEPDIRRLWRPISIMASPFSPMILLRDAMRSQQPT